jgi:hypothetical protein
MLVLLLTSLILIGDPIGDARGDGSLIPPTASVLDAGGGFDLELIKVLTGPTLSIEITLASTPNQLTLIEGYLNTVAGGLNHALPGSGMSLPKNTGWEYAFRITTEGVSGYMASQSVGPPDSEFSYHEIPMELHQEGRILKVRTEVPPPESVQVFAIVGLFDPFGPTPWRPVASHPSPWAFSNQVPSPPVIDLLAPTMASQREAINRRVLPVPERRYRIWPWFSIMITGLVLAIIGLALRLSYRSFDRFMPDQSSVSNPENLLQNLEADESPTKTAPIVEPLHLEDRTALAEDKALNNPDITGAANNDNPVPAPDRVSVDIESGSPQGLPVRNVEISGTNKQPRPPEYSVRKAATQPTNEGAETEFSDDNSAKTSRTSDDLG